STFSPNLLNEFRFSWPYRKNRHFAGPKTGPGPAVTISGVANFNGTTGAGDRFAEKIPSLNENLTIIRGRHSLKVGAAWQENVDLQAPQVFTQYTFPTIAAYLAAKNGTNPRSYTTVKQNAGVGIGYHSVFWSWYGQDSWQVTPKLMLIGGVRYDKFVPPDANPTAPFLNSRKFNSASANFAPRLGFAYRVTTTTVVRGSGGIFYDAPATNTWFNPLQTNGISPNFSLPPTAANAPAFPALTLTPANSSTFADLVTVAPNFRNAYTINTSLNVQHELSKNDSITIGYIHTAGRNLEFQRNINTPAVIRFLADGRPVFGTNSSTRPFQGFGNITQEESGARSNYDAAVVNYTHRLTAGVEMSASYTWSHTISDAPEANSFEQNFPIIDPTNRLRDRGNSYVNRPHSLTISSIFQPRIQADNAVWRHLANDNMFALLVNLSSGDQQNILANTNLNGDATNSTSQNQRPAFVPRNSVRGPNIYQLDARYTRTIGTFWERVKPQVFLEANNLFNHPNITTINTTATVNATTGLITTAPTFARQSTVLEGRIVQFGASVRF
ncbi:MAG TPA: TonB-dependent receptor, partial [Terriglobales bacterium]